MALTKSTVKRAIDTSGDDIRVFLDSASKNIQGMALADEDGDHAGIISNPLIVTQKDSVLEESYSIVQNIADGTVGNDDCFLYIKNNSATNLNITHMWIWIKSSMYIYAKLGDSGTTSGGSAVTPVNRYAGSSNTADCTCEYGSNITGLSGGSTVVKLRPTGGHMYEYYLDLLIPQNQVVTFYAGTNMMAIDIQLFINFR